MDNQNSSLKNNTLKPFHIIGVSLVLGIAYDNFFYNKAFGINFPLFILLILAGLFVISTFFDKKLPKKAIIWLAVPLLFFAFMVSIRSSELLTFLNVVASIILLLLISEAIIDDRVKDYLLFDYFKILFLPFKFIKPFFQTVAEARSFKKSINKSKTLFQVIKGIAMALPVLVIFLLLFSSADLVFQKYILKFTDIDINTGEIIWQLLRVLFMTALFMGAYTYILKKFDNPVQEMKNVLYKIGIIEAGVFLGLINMLFLLFIFIQLTYLFGGESNISAQGFTYSEYARKGFFELITVAIISFLMLWVTEKYIERKNSDRHAAPFKILSSLLIIQVVLIMVSAFKRLLLYEEAYGFTILRLYSHVFIIWLAIIFVLLLYKILIDRREKVFIFQAFISIVLFLMFLNIINPDAFVARENIARFAQKGELDVTYLNQLSDDAIPETIKILNLSNENLKRSFASCLYQRVQNREGLSSLSPWQSINFAKYRAEKILEARMKELEENK